MGHSHHLRWAGHRDCNLAAGSRGQAAVTDVTTARCEGSLLVRPYLDTCGRHVTCSTCGTAIGETTCGGRTSSSAFTHYCESCGPSYVISVAAVIQKDKNGHILQQAAWVTGCCRWWLTAAAREADLPLGVAACHCMEWRIAAVSGSTLLPLPRKQTYTRAAASCSRQLLLPLVSRPPCHCSWEGGSLAKGDCLLQSVASHCHLQYSFGCILVMKYNT